MKTKQRKSVRPLLAVIAVLLTVIAVLLAVLVFGGGDGGQLPKPHPSPALDTGWALRLVNPWTEMPEGFVPPLTETEDGYLVDSRCAEALEAMLADCRAAGLSPVICSAYRTAERQQELYENKVQRVMAEGHGRTEAETLAAEVVALPGTSEHQLGLAVDLVDANYMELDEAQEQTAVQQWLMAHCAEYGFILRYPTGKSEVTGIIYEPWHYRYVGTDTAREIMSSGLCLEEYLSR